MRFFQAIHRRILNSIFRGKISIGYDTNLQRCNFVIHGNGIIAVRNNVISRKNTTFSASNGIIEVEDGCFFNTNCNIVSHKKVSIGKNTIIGPNVCIYDHDHKFALYDGIKKNEFNCDDVIIGERCWIGANSVILRGTRIGDGCIVGAGTVVKGEFGDNVIITNKRELDVRPIRD